MDGDDAPMVGVCDAPDDAGEEPVAPACPEEEEEPDMLDELLLFVPFTDTVSRVLPRCDGSRTIWLSEQYSWGVPSARIRLTRTVTFQRLAMLFCSQSSDQVQSGSSSRGVSLWEESGITPIVTS
jgi:hypothetical protein